MCISYMQIWLCNEFHYLRIEIMWILGRKHPHWSQKDKSTHYRRVFRLTSVFYFKRSQISHDHHNDSNTTRTNMKHGWKKNVTKGTLFHLGREPALKHPSCIPVSIAGLLAGRSALSTWRSGAVIRFRLRCFRRKTNMWFVKKRPLKQKGDVHCCQNHLWVALCKARPCGGGNPETCWARKTSNREEEDREALWENNRGRLFRTTFWWVLWWLQNAELNEHGWISLFKFYLKWHWF